MQKILGKRERNIFDPKAKTPFKLSRSRIENFVGIQYLHETTNFIITGAVDDIWINPKSELIVVDYKATSTETEITLDAEYRQAYKRQMEIYQWLFRRNGFTVSDTGYFMYVERAQRQKSVRQEAGIRSETADAHGVRRVGGTGDQ